MRIRSTKPEFWRSERIASVSWDARLVLKGLESYVDDNGVGKDDLALIVADVFPRDLSGNPAGTLRRVSEAISDLHDAGLLWRYEHGGTRLLYVAFWESIQRIEKPSKGRLPRPDGTLDYRESEIRESLPEHSGSIPGGLRPGTEDQGNRGSGKLPCSSAGAESESDGRDDDYSPAYDRAQTKRRDADRYAEFDAWYAQYPRKVGKGQAMKAYRTARKKTDADTLLAAVRSQAPALTARGTQYCPHPATWLNGERWTDEPSTVTPPAASNGRRRPNDDIDWNAAMQRAHQRDQETLT